MQLLLMLKMEIFSEFSHHLKQLATEGWTHQLQEYSQQESALHLL